MSELDEEIKLLGVDRCIDRARHIAECKTDEQRESVRRWHDKELDVARKREKIMTPGVIS